jgi:hypothetical protein
MILPLALLLLASSEQPSATDTALWVGRSAELALACVHKEYPNKIAHVLNGDNDVRAPHELTPAFYGCYDWHSSVHGHWLLARVARLHDRSVCSARGRHSTEHHRGEYRRRSATRMRAASPSRDRMGGVASPTPYRAARMGDRTAADMTFEMG